MLWILHLVSANQRQGLLAIDQSEAGPSVISALAITQVSAESLSSGPGAKHGNQQKWPGGATSGLGTCQKQITTGHNALQTMICDL